MTAAVERAQRGGAVERHPYQPRRLGGELGQVQIQAHRAEAVGLFDDRSAVAFDHVGELFQRVTLGAGGGEREVVGAPSLGLDDEVEHDIVGHPPGVRLAELRIEVEHIRGDAHAWYRRQHPNACRPGHRSCIP